MSRAVNKAYDIIREMIVSGQLKPGARLREEELTDMTGVSRTPVREALRLLVEDGFVVRHENRGASVPVLTEHDINEIYGLRALLAGHAARRAAMRISSDDIDQLEEINTKLKELSKAGTTPGHASPDRAEVIQLYDAFHRIVLEASNNFRMVDMVQKLSQTALTARTFARFSGKDEQRNLDGHEELIRALRSGHPDWAEAAMRSHVHNAWRIMTQIAQDEGHLGPESEN